MKNIYKHINLDYVNELADGSPEFIKEMIDIFLSQVPEFTYELNTLYHIKNYIELARTAHKAKSSVAIMGMYELSEDLKTLELLAKDGMSPEKYREIIDKFDSECKNACTELKEYLQTV